MELTDQPCYLTALHFFENRKKDSDGGSLVEITLEFTDLGPELCDAINPGVRARLFAREGKPVDELASAAINLPVALHIVHLAPAPGMPAAITITEAEPRPTLKVRRLKKAPQYVATLKFAAAHPDRDLLAKLVDGLRKQHRLTVVRQQGLLEDATQQDESPRIAGRRRKPQPVDQALPGTESTLPSAGAMPPAKPLRQTR